MIKDKEAAELERLEKSKEGEDGSAPVENEEEPTEEEIAANARKKPSFDKDAVDKG